MIELKKIGKQYRVGSRKNESLFDTLVGRNSYFSLWALRNINFKIKKGECVGVIGENGSGKTTLLKVIGGITTPTKGSVHIRGDTVSLLELGLNFQPELTGRENAYLYASVMGMTRSEIDRKLNNIISFSGLHKFIDAKLASYSFGMCVRLAFAVAMQTDADIMLVDEVIAVGDINFKRKCMKAFERLKKEGRTMLIATHDISIIERFCDKTIMLDKGKVLDFGKTGYILKKYEAMMRKR